MRHETAPQAKHFFSGLIDMTGVTNRSDEEIFGPLLQVYRTKSFEDAIDRSQQYRIWTIQPVC